jgi:small subunit ribosomal protein S11e
MNYIDKKCPFTGNVSIRGRILTGKGVGQELRCNDILAGTIIKTKMQRTCVIRRDYMHFVRKYNRYEKRHKNMSVHISPCFRFVCMGLHFGLTVCRDAAVGDIVTVGECRSLSKTVRFNVVKLNKAPSAKKAFDKF